MNTQLKWAGLLAALLPCILAGCANPSPTPPAPSSNGVISPMEYQECIQAAMTGNGQASNEKCDQILKATR